MRGVLRSWISEKIRNMIFRKWGGGVKGRLELFRKFIRFGRGMLPWHLAWSKETFTSAAHIVVATPLSENREHCHFPLQIWKIAIRYCEVTGLMMWNCAALRWWVKSVLLSNVSCSDFSLKIIEKHTLKIPLCIIFMPKKPCSKVQILQYKFLDWKWPPPLRNFSENSSVLVGTGFP